jgi:hypothetical protein
MIASGNVTISTASTQAITIQNPLSHQPTNTK